MKINIMEDYLDAEKHKVNSEKIVCLLRFKIDKGQQRSMTFC